MYFADDAVRNVEAVKDVLSLYNRFKVEMSLMLVGFWFSIIARNALVDNVGKNKFQEMENKKIADTKITVPQFLTHPHKITAATKRELNIPI